MSDESIHCVNHPERTFLERCEVCGDPLCGYCLYYTDDGQRLCEKHAQTARASGVVVYPPAVYAQGIIASQAEARPKPVDIDDSDISDVKVKNPGRRAIYHGNNHDLNAFIAMGIGVFSLASCCGASFCLPFAGVLLGILALLNARDSIDPRRTRQQAWIGILTGGCMAGCILTVVALYVFAYGAIIASVSSQSFSTPFFFPTSTVTVAPTDTPAPNVEPSQLTATAQPFQTTAP